MIALRRPPGEFARVGHRGASALAPENTLHAFELAVELGCERGPQLGRAPCQGGEALGLRIGREDARGRPGGAEARPATLEDADAEAALPSAPG